MMHPILAYFLLLLTGWLAWMLAIGSSVAAIPFFLILLILADSAIQYAARARRRAAYRRELDAWLTQLHETRKDHQ